jgi:hypothetical protein
VPRDVKRARFKARLRRDRFDQKPGPPKRGDGGPVPPKGRRREGGKKKDDE